MLDHELSTLWGWSKHGIVIDLKTQLRLASDISAGHAREVATYVHGTDTMGEGRRRPGRVKPPALRRTPQQLHALVHSLTAFCTP